MSHGKTTPRGWKKGSELIVSRTGSHEKEWTISERKYLDFTRRQPQDKNEVAFIWFYTWSDCAEFIEWWNEEEP